MKSLTKSVETAILSAVAYFLTLIAVPIIPITPDLKLDLSDLPILFGMISLGLVSGIEIAGFKSLLNLIVTGLALPNLMGEFLSFSASVVILVTIFTGLKWGRDGLSRPKCWLIVGIETLSLILVMVAANAVCLPVYFRIAGFRVAFPVVNLILYGVVPFNLIKGCLIGTLFFEMKRQLGYISKFRKFR